MKYYLFLLLFSSGTLICQNVNWAFTLGNSWISYPTAMEMDASDNVYIFGSHEGNVSVKKFVKR